MIAALKGRKLRTLTEDETRNLRRMAKSDAYGSRRIARTLGISEDVLRREAVRLGIVITPKTRD